jgi:hypothetical protein
MGFGPGEGLGNRLLAVMKSSMHRRSCAGLVKLAPSMAWRLRMENQTSIWFIQEAWVGVKWKRKLG